MWRERLRSEAWEPTRSRAKTDPDEEGLPSSQHLGPTSPIMQPLETYEILPASYESLKSRPRSFNEIVWLIFSDMTKVLQRRGANEVPL